MDEAERGGGMTVIIYPDNSACVDGKLLSTDVAAGILQQYSVSHVRPSRNTDESEHPVVKRRKGLTLCVYNQPSEFNSKVSAARKGNKNFARDERLRLRNEEIHGEYQMLRNASRLSHADACLVLGQKHGLGPKRIHDVVTRMMRGAA